MSVRIRDGRVEEVELRIFEPPRFFEALLRGRSFTEAPDITARICGICPVAYQTSAVNAIEDACGVELPGRSACCAGSSTAANGSRATPSTSTCFTLPTSSATTSAVQMAREHRRDVVERGLALKKTGNAMLDAHRRPRDPPGQRARRRLLPGADARRAAALVDPLERAREAALETVTRWTPSFDFPDFEHCLRARRPLASRADVRDRGRPHRLAPRVSTSPSANTTSTSPRSTSSSRTRCTRAAPARRATSSARSRATRSTRDRLSPLARETAARSGPRPISAATPSAASSSAAVELVYACDEALRIIDGYERAGRAGRRRRATRRSRARRQRGAARAALPPLHARRRRHDPRREDRAADVAEPARNRGRPARRRQPHTVELAGRGAPRSLRADDPQLRPLHLVRDALPRLSRWTGRERTHCGDRRR